MPRKLSALLLIVGCLTSTVLGQSGRSRPRPEERPAPPKPPQPTPSTSSGTPTPVPVKIGAGAGITDQAQTGLTTRYTFKNGLTVVVNEEHSTPIATVLIHVNAGSVDEPDAARGVARVTANAVLRGTQTRPGDAWARQVAAAGGHFQTRADAVGTEIVSSGLVESAAALIDLAADAVTRPAFTDESVTAAAKAVQRERAALEEDAAAYSAMRWFAAAHAGKPLGRPEATPDQIGALKRDAAARFHAARYTPGNTVVVVTGDIIGPLVLRSLQQAFGQWSGAAGDAKLAEGDQKTLQYLEERGPTTLSWVHLGYVVPSVGADAPTWDVLRAVLGLGRGARLVQNLRDARGIVSDIRVEYVSMRNSSQFVIGLRAVPESIDRAEALTIEIVERLRRERISDAELQRAKSLLEKDFITRTETGEGAARMFSRTAGAADFKTWSNYLGQLRLVTAEQVRALAAKHLTVSRLTVHEYQSPSAPPRTFTPEKYAETVGLWVPASARFEIPEDSIRDAKGPTPIKQGANRETRQDVGKFIVMAQAEPVRDFSTLRGPKAFVRVDPNRPLLVVGLFFQGGRSVEDESRCGVTELMLRSMLRGTAKQPGDELLAEMEQLGGEIRVVNELDFFGLELEILSRNGEEGLKRLIDLLENPSFDKDAVKRERDRLLADQLAAGDKGDEEVRELARRSLYPGHPYGFPRLGTSAGVSKLTEDDLQKWLARTAKRQMPMAVIVGDTDGSGLVARVLSNAFTRNELDRSLKVVFADPASQPVEQTGDSGRPVSYVGWTWAGPESRNAQAPEWPVAAEILTARLAESEGTAGNRVFEAGFTPRLQRCDFYLTAGGTGGDEARLRGAFESLMKDLGTRPVSDEERQNAARRASVRFARDIESFSGRLRTYAMTVFLGLSAGTVEENLDKLARVGTSAVQSVVSTVAKTPPGRGTVRAGASPGKE